MCIVVPLVVREKEMVSWVRSLATENAINGEKNRWANVRATGMEWLVDDSHLIPFAGLLSMTQGSMSLDL